ncbi:hypothetical protein GCM10011416_00610 [Polaribacter pacificus]|uniref:Tetratricopeptide repeat-containing protein n=1 Tax=Polaribacter pacificus TaxID=1775173 RepID=A0A917HRK9_9FLAO|nr:tetratricopeptide repeat protein [Polaribacter pacificus]GGG88237.1 hypothetical protein GCM10011416_00610 [Polaribacter pacificus]
MKKQILALTIGLASVASFAQKNELKAAEKALKKNDFAAAVAAISSAEALIANADEKTKSKFYFLKGNAYAGKKDLKTAGNAYNELLDFEKKSGKKRYSDKVQPILSGLIKTVSEKAINQYNAKDYKGATENFELTYNLSPKDTAFLFNAAVSASIAKDHEASLKHYNSLRKLGYTGITTQYMATSKETNELEDLGSKQQRDLMVRTGAYINPVDKNSESKAAGIIKSIANILSEQGKYEEAVATIKEARAMNPEDLSLLLTEADFYIKLNKMDEFATLMKEAVVKDPNNAMLFYNLGVVTFGQGQIEEAKKYYKKAIEIDPNYSDAYLNLSIAILAKDKAIVEEMNKSLSDFKKYDELEKQQKAVYKEALPYLEKGDALKRTNETVKTLLNIYQILENEAKAKEYAELYKKMQ